MADEKTANRTISARRAREARIRTLCHGFGRLSPVVVAALGAPRKKSRQLANQRLGTKGKFTANLRGDPQSGTKMPLAPGIALQQADLDKIDKWQSDGAPNN